MDVLLVTCEKYPEGEPETRQLAERLRAGGLEARVAAWSDPAVDWGGASLVVLRSTWDYHRHLDEFLDWTDGVAGATRLRNPVEVIRWNAHKGYLLDLERRGIPIVDTVLVKAPEAARAAAIAQARGWHEAVVKPAVSADGEGAQRIGIGQAAVDAHGRDLLVQPFVPAIATEGELSVVWAAGVMEAVRKRPGHGDFRVQFQFGGSHTAEPLDPACAELARACLASVDADLLYARIDMIRHEGAWRVMELELIEPSLFLEDCPAVEEALIGEIRRRVGR